MKGPAHDKLWNQLEAEIHLHRHKTVIRACRGRNDPKKPLPSPVGHVRQLTSYFHRAAIYNFCLAMQLYNIQYGIWLITKANCMSSFAGHRLFKEDSGSRSYTQSCSDQRRSRRARNLHYSKFKPLNDIKLAINE